MIRVESESCKKFQLELKSLYERLTKDVDTVGGDVCFTWNCSNTTQSMYITLDLWANVEHGGIDEFKVRVSNHGSMRMGENDWNWSFENYDLTLLEDRYNQLNATS